MINPTPADLRALLKAHKLTHAQAVALLPGVNIKTLQAWLYEQNPISLIAWELLNLKLTARHQTKRDQK